MKTLLSAVALVLLAGPSNPVWPQQPAPPTLPSYEAPPPMQEFAPAVSVPQNQAPLDETGIKRARALIPLLGSAASFWAMGEFNHLGRPAIPVLREALRDKDPKVRRNAVEVLSWMPDAQAAPDLLERALDPQEVPNVRIQAFRLAAAVAPESIADALLVLTKEENSSMRMEAARAAVRVKDKRVVSAMIGLLQDEQAFVAVSAINALWTLTKHPSEDHDWAYSRQHERAEWSQEWIDWWKAEGERFEFPPAPKK